MKKIFSLLCVAVVALSASAFTPVVRTDATVEKGAHLKVLAPKAIAHKANKPAAPATFAATANISITNLTATTATVTVTPADANTYYWDIMPAEDFDGLQSGEYAPTYADVAAYFSAYIPYQAEQYAMFGYTIADFLSSGVDTYDYEGLTPNTTYVAFAMLANATTGACQAPFVTERFTTPNVAASNNTITMAYNAANNSINITTTNNDPYFFIFETQEEYDMYQRDFSQASLADEVGEWITTANQFSMTSYFIYNGNQTINVNDFWTTYLSDEDLETGNYVAFAAPYAGAINGNIAYTQFQYTAAPVVATDSMELRIIRPEWSDHVADAGWWQVMGAESVDTLYFVSLSPNYCTSVAGTYTWADMDKDYSFIYVDADQYSYAFANLNIVITVNASAINIKATGIAKNGILYKITFDPIDRTALDDVIETFKASKSVQNGQLIIEKDGVRYNALGTVIK